MAGRHRRRLDRAQQVDFAQTGRSHLNVRRLRDRVVSHVRKGQAFPLKGGVARAALVS